MKCPCLSVLLVYATQRTANANCVALAILLGMCTNSLMIYVPTEVMRLYLQRYTQQSSRTELHFRHRVPYSFGWDRESSYKRLSQLALDLMASPASQAYVERLLSLYDPTARKWNRTRVFLYRRIFLKL